MPNTGYEFSREEVFKARDWFETGRYPNELNDDSLKKHKFREKMRRLYWDMEKQKLYIRVKTDSTGAVSRADEEPVNELEAPRDVQYLQIIPREDRESYLDHFMKYPHTCSYNSKCLHDKLLRSGFTGVTRDWLHEYLKHPKFAKYIAGKKSTTTWIKSYRPSKPFELWQIDHTDIEGIMERTEDEEKAAPVKKGASKTPKTTKKTKMIYPYLFVIVDAFSKFVYLFPVPDKGNDTVMKILTKLFMDGDIPKQIQGDQAFVTREMKRFLEDEWGVHLVGGKSNRPNQQGLVERVNRTIKDNLKKHMIRAWSDKWVGMVPYLQLGLNSTKHDSTRYSPLVLHRGHDPISSFARPIDKFKDILEDTVTLDAVLAENYRPFEDKEWPNNNEDDEFKMKSHSENIERARVNINKAADRREKRLRDNQQGVLDVNSYVKIATYLHRQNGVSEPTCNNVSPVVLGLLLVSDEQLANFDNVVLDPTDKSNLGILNNQFHGNVVKQRNPFLMGIARELRPKTDKAVPITLSRKKNRVPFSWELGAKMPATLTAEQKEKWKGSNNNSLQIIKSFPKTQRYQLLYTQYVVNRNGSDGVKKWLAVVQINRNNNLVWASYIHRDYLKHLHNHTGEKWAQPAAGKKAYDHKFYDTHSYMQD